MCLDLRHSFEGIILGFASSRKRFWRSTISLKAITDRPEVSALSLRVRLEPERERSLIGHDYNMGCGGSSAQNSTATGTVWALYDARFTLSIRTSLPQPDSGPIAIREFNSGAFERGADGRNSRFRERTPSPLEIHNCGQPQAGRPCEFGLSPIQ
jgi:hypothetical protein